MYTEYSSVNNCQLLSQAGLSVALIFCAYEQCLAMIRSYIHEEELPAVTSESRR